MDCRFVQAWLGKAIIYSKTIDSRLAWNRSLASLFVVGFLFFLPFPSPHLWFIIPQIKVFAYFVNSSLRIRSVGLQYMCYERREKNSRQETKLVKSSYHTQQPWRPQVCHDQYNTRLKMRIYSWMKSKRPELIQGKPKRPVRI